MFSHEPTSPSAPPHSSSMVPPTPTRIYIVRPVTQPIKKGHVMGNDRDRRDKRGAVITRVALPPSTFSSAMRSFLPCSCSVACTWDKRPAATLCSLMGCFFVRCLVILYWTELSAFQHHLLEKECFAINHDNNSNKKDTVLFCHSSLEAWASLSQEKGFICQCNVLHMNYLTSLLVVWLKNTFFQPRTLKIWMTDFLAFRTLPTKWWPAGFNQPTKPPTLAMTGFQNNHQ